MKGKITKVIAILLVCSFVISFAGCSKIEEFFDLSNSHGHERNDDDESEETETEETEQTDPSEPVPTVDVEGNGLTYPDHIPTYDEIHPSHPNGTVSGQEAVDILNDIESQIIADSIGGSYVMSEIFFADYESLGISFDEDEIGWLRGYSLLTRKPVIYSFLVSVGTDALTVPILDDVKKLSQEQGDPLLETQRVAYELQFERLSGMVFEKFLNSVAQMNSLELNDAKLLYYLYKKKEKCSMEELQTACDISNASAVLSLAKLVAASRVRIADLKIFESDKVFYEYISSDLDDQFDKAEEDYRSLVYDGLSNEDIAAYARIRKLIYANMEKTIIKE